MSRNRLIVAGVSFAVAIWVGVLPYGMGVGAPKAAIASGPKICVGTVMSRLGRSPSINNAKRNARIKWRSDVRATPTLGNEYADWSIAEDRQYKCSKKLGVHRCSAWARPCTRTN